MTIHLSPNRVAGTAAIAALLVVTSACGSSDGASRGAPSSAPTVSATPTTPTATSTPGSAPTPASAASPTSADGAMDGDASSESGQAPPRATSDSTQRAEPDPSRTSAAGDEPRSTPTRLADAEQGGLPTDAGDYGDEVVAAWSAGRSVDRFTSSSAAKALRDGERATGLVRVACEADMCSYANEAGRRVTLTFDRDRLERGATDAVVAAKVG